MMCYWMDHSLLQSESVSKPRACQSDQSWQPACLGDPVSTFPALRLKINTIPSSLYMGSGALSSGLHACMAITSSIETIDGFNVSVYYFITQNAKKIFSKRKLLFTLLLVTKFIKSFAFKELSQQCLSYNCHSQLSYSVKLLNRHQTPSLTILLLGLSLYYQR